MAYTHELLRYKKWMINLDLHARYSRIDDLTYQTTTSIPHAQHGTAVF